MSNQQGWQGQLNLIYSYQFQETLITHQYSQAPLKIQQPFYPESKEICHSVILHTAGGLVGGDRLLQTIHLEANSQALITTAAAGKIYGNHPQKSQQEITLTLENNAILEWFPQETIIFNNAIYQQQLNVNLALNATIFLWEINRFGRTARGEKFTDGEWRSQTEIWQEKTPIWVDRQRLLGGKLIDFSNGLKSYSVTGSFIYLGQAVDLGTIEKIRELWHQSHYEGEGGVTQSLREGVICRYRGHSTAEAREWFTQVWHLLRQVYLQRPSIYPRIWLR